MAKRYITTELFDDSWFMDLPSKYKLFWVYLLTKCNYSGIWQVNWKLAQFYTGDNLEPTEVQRVLRDRYFIIEDGKYWFIPKFIEFQYGNNLNHSNSVHKGIIETLKKYDLLKYLPKTNISEGANQTLHRPYEGTKDKEKDKDKEIDKDKDKEIPLLSEFISYCKTLSIYHSSLDFQIEAKYNSWVENKWKDGNNKPIKNWKTKIQNTLPYFKKAYDGTRTSGQRRKDYVTKDEYESELKSLYEDGNKT